MDSRLVSLRCDECVRMLCQKLRYMLCSALEAVRLGRMELRNETVLVRVLLL